jgi:hypothetical protein
LDAINERGKEREMAYMRIVRPPMVTPEIYDAVNERLDVLGDPPDGLIMHAAGALEGQWQIVEAWETEEHARRFDDARLTPAIEAVAGQPPQSPAAVGYELHQLITP